MAGDAEKAMNEALNALASLQEKRDVDEFNHLEMAISPKFEIRVLLFQKKDQGPKIKNSILLGQYIKDLAGWNIGDYLQFKTERKDTCTVEKSGDDTENIRNTINLLRKDVKNQKKEENKYIKGAQSVVSVAQSVVDNYDKFTSGDALEIASGTIALIGTIGGVVGGPYGPLIAGVCGLIASILPLFGGKKGPSMSEVVDKVIREALDDFRDEEIYGEVIGSLKEMTAHIAQLTGVASHNSGHLSEEGKTLLTSTVFTTVGSSTLGALQGQIEKYKSIRNDERKSQRIAKYAYFYCMVSVQRTVIMNLQCSLLRVNDMEGVFAGVSHYLYEVLPTEDRKVLEFVSMLPSSNDWWMLYRCLHTTLTAPQRGILSAYTKQIGCPQ